MTNRKLQAIINYAPSATAGEVAQQLQDRPLFYVVEAMGAFEVIHEESTTTSQDEAMDYYMQKVAEDVADGQLEDIALASYYLMEVN